MENQVQGCQALLAIDQFGTDRSVNPN